MFAPDHAATAAQLARVVKPGGRLGLTNWRGGGRRRRSLQADGPVPARAAAVEPVRLGERGVVTGLLGEHFELEFSSEDSVYEFPTGESYWELMSPARTARRRRSSTRSTTTRRDELHRPGSRTTTGSSSGDHVVQHRSYLLTAGHAPLSEVVELLQRLIRVDTTNPPGNETAAAELLREYLEAAGVECELYAKTPERANLVARIRGRGDGPSLAFLSHTDVVLADADEWQRDPFGGELVDGEVWGRGALDMKGEVAASAVALATLAREGWRGSGDLIFVAAADEEVGDGFGLKWLVEAHPDAVRADFSVNEGAGDRVELGGKTIYLCSTAEKMSAPFLLRVHGRSGHASMPAIADNALVKAAPLIERLGAFADRAGADPGGRGLPARRARRRAGCRATRSPLRAPSPRSQPS